MISFLRNCWFWIRHLDRWKKASEEIENWTEELKTETDVEILLSEFVWISDGLVDWKPWIRTIFARYLNDDCDGAAVLTIWALKQIDKSGQYISLKGKGGNHAIVYCDKKIYSNGRAMRIGVGIE